MIRSLTVVPIMPSQCEAKAPVDVVQMKQGCELHFTKPGQGAEPLALVFQGVVSMQNGSPAKITPKKRPASSQGVLASTHDSALASPGVASLTPSSKRPAGSLHGCTAIFSQAAECAEIIQKFQVHTRSIWIRMNA